MRITCDVDVANRLLPAFNMRGKCKAIRTQLAVGHKPGNKDAEVYLMLATKQDRNGQRYSLKGNVEKFFTKFLHEGKASIRLAKPPHDICISKADPIHLKSFLTVVQMAHKGEGLDKVTLAPLAPISVKQAEKLRTKMTIASRKDYPITTAFPSSLKTLIIQTCSLKRFDSRILKLRNLVSLDLSHNHIQTLPEDFNGTPHLSEINLSDNHLAEIPRGFCTGNLSKSLNLLDLSQNKLKFLRPYFCQMTSLVTLKINSNELVCLPSHLGKLSNMRYFSASGNKLRTLPATFGSLQLDDLDLYDNLFMNDGPSTIINKLSFPSLQEIAARAIVRFKLTFTEEDLPGHLLDLLNSVKYCVCGQPCLQSFVHYLARLDLHKVTGSVTGIDSSGRTHAPCEAFLCSHACLDWYQKHPNATIWRK